MKMKMHIRLFGFSAVVLLTLTAAIPTHADFTNTSASFSLGYGFVGPTTVASTWNTTETAAANTATTLGSFSFIPTVSGRPFSGSGPTFVNRVLGNGVYDVNKSGWSTNFQASLTGSYNTALPVWAEDVKLTLNVTSISIYGAKLAGFGTGSMQFQETTPAHGASSTTVTLNDVADATSGLSPFRTATQWKQLVWDPADFAVAGTSSTRSFNLGAFAANQGYGIDGFEIQGNVVLTYIPEPSGLALLGLGGIFALRRRVQQK